MNRMHQGVSKRRSGAGRDVLVLVFSMGGVLAFIWWIGGMQYWR